MYALYMNHYWGLQSDYDNSWLVTLTRIMHIMATE